MKYNVKAFRKVRNSNPEKYYAVQIGSAWTDNRGVIRLNLDALPIPDDQGQVTCFLEVREERPQQGEQ